MEEGQVVELNESALCATLVDRVEERSGIPLEVYLPEGYSEDLIGGDSEGVSCGAVPAEYAVVGPQADEDGGDGVDESGGFGVSVLESSAGLLLFGDIDDRADNASERRVRCGDLVAGLVEDIVSSFFARGLDRPFVSLLSAVGEEIGIQFFAESGPFGDNELVDGMSKDLITRSVEEFAEGAVAADVPSVAILVEERAGDGFDEGGEEVSLVGGVGGAELGGGVAGDVVWTIALDSDFVVAHRTSLLP